MQQHLFKYKDEDQLNEVRSVEIDGKIWFVGVDVTGVLGYTNSSKAIADHCKDKGITKRYPLLTPGGVQTVTLINESNVYRLIVKSKLQSAERFEAWLFEEVIPSIRKKGYYGAIDRAVLPNTLIRFRDNFHKPDKGYFCVIGEMIHYLYIEFEKLGYVIPDKGELGQQMMPDISIGRTFADYLKRTESPFLDSHKYYAHTFPDGREVQARQYPIDALPTFIRFLMDVWIPQYAEPYFRTRDPLALDYLPKLIGDGKAA